MKKNFLLYTLPVLAIPLVPTLSSVVNTNDLKNNQRLVACNQQAISSYASSGTILEGSSTNIDSRDYIQANMYFWELKALLDYETNTGTLKFFESTLTQNLWNITDGTLTQDAVIVSYNINSRPDGKNEVSVQVKDGSNYWQLPTVIFGEFINTQEPTQFLIRENSLKELAASDVVSTVFTSGYQIKKNIYCNIPDGQSYFGDNLKIVNFHNKNSNVAKFYPSNIKFEQPTTNFTIKDINNEQGVISLNVNFTGGSSIIGSNQNQYNPFRIAYFDIDGNPVTINAVNTPVGVGINQTFDLSGFMKKDSTLAIFAGTDGQFLMYELIGVAVLLFLTILYTIIHISRRNKRLSSVRRVETRK